MQQHKVYSLVSFLVCLLLLGVEGSARSEERAKEDSDMTVTVYWFKIVESGGKDGDIFGPYYTAVDRDEAEKRWTEASRKTDTTKFTTPYETRQRVGRLPGGKPAEPPVPPKSAGKPSGSGKLAIVTTYRVVNGKMVKYPFGGYITDSDYKGAMEYAEKVNRLRGWAASIRATGWKEKPKITMPEKAWVDLTYNPPASVKPKATINLVGTKWRQENKEKGVLWITIYKFDSDGKGVTQRTVGGKALDEGSFKWRKDGTKILWKADDVEYELSFRDNVMRFLKDGNPLPGITAIQRR